MTELPPNSLGLNGLTPLALSALPLVRPVVQSANNIMTDMPSDSVELSHVFGIDLAPGLAWTVSADKAPTVRVPKIDLPTTISSSGPNPFWVKPEDFSGIELTSATTGFREKSSGTLEGDYKSALKWGNDALADIIFGPPQTIASQPDLKTATQDLLGDFTFQFQELTADVIPTRDPGDKSQLT